MVSIIIPVYNAEQYLVRCLESVLAQSYQDYEVILINDGSNDGSKEICDAFVDRDARFHVVHKSNQGVARARNTALDLVKGEYITFIDSDDYIEEDYLGKLVSVIEAEKADISQCFWRRPKTKYKELQDIPNNMKMLCFDKHEALLDFVTNNILGNAVWGKLYCREVFEKIRFPEMHTGEDSMLLLQIYQRVSKIVSVPYIGYIYYLNPIGLDSSRINDLNSVRVGEYLTSYAMKNDKRLIKPAMTKYTIFLFDAYFEAIRNRNIKNIEFLSGKIKQLKISQIDSLYKYKLLILLFRLNKNRAEYICKKLI